MTERFLEEFIKKQKITQKSFWEWLEIFVPKAKGMSAFVPKMTHSSIKSNTVVPMPEEDDFNRVQDMVCSLSTKLDLAMDITRGAGENKLLLDGFTFLKQEFDNKKTVLECLYDDDLKLKKLLTQKTSLKYADIKTAFLKLFDKPDVCQTHPFLKQVHFPVKENEYVLLSLLSSTPLMYEVKKRTGFSEKNKELKEIRKDQGYSDEVISELHFTSLINMKYGGNNPQNISGLCSKAAGHFVSFLSVPPKQNYSNENSHPLKKEI